MFHFTNRQTNVLQIDKRKFGSPAKTLPGVLSATPGKTTI
jgi:hypothetical protein